MSIFELNTASAFVKAVDAASESDHRNAARRSSSTPRSQGSSLFVLVAGTVRRILAQAVRAAAGGTEDRSRQSGRQRT